MPEQLLPLEIKGAATGAWSRMKAEMPQRRAMKLGKKVRLAASVALVAGMARTMPGSGRAMALRQKTALPVQARLRA
jgi:hypothetical protein